MPVEGPLKEPSLYITTFIFLFSFRNSLMVAAASGAFEVYATEADDEEAKNPKSRYGRKFIYAALILVVLPLSAYFPGLGAVGVLANVPLSALQSLDLAGLDGLYQNLLILFTILGIGLFPRVSKHVWMLLLKLRQSDVTHYQNPQEEGNKKLPEVEYSVQAIVSYCAVFIIISSISVWQHGIGILISQLSISGLFSALYISQFIVLYHTGKLRGYYEHKPKRLLSWRMILAVFVTIIIPGLMGLWLMRQDLVFMHAPFILFPLYCNQALLLRAKRKNWETRRPITLLAKPSVPAEIKFGNEDNWWYFLCLALYCLGFFACQVVS